MEDPSIFKKVQGKFEDQGDGVGVASSTLEKLKSGFKKTMKQVDIIHEKWQKKLDSAPIIFRCNECVENFPTEEAVKTHWSDEKIECRGAKGFREMPDVELTPDDRLTGKQLELSKEVKKTQKAAKNIAYNISSKKSNEGKIDAVRLMRYPIGNFERVLKEADTSDLEEFVEMKFSGGTASKKLLAQKEIKIRRNKEKTEKT